MASQAATEGSLVLLSCRISYHPDRARNRYTGPWVREERTCRNAQFVNSPDFSTANPTYLVIPTARRFRKNPCFFPKFATRHETTVLRLTSQTCRDKGTASANQHDLGPDRQRTTHPRSYHSEQAPRPAKVSPNRYPHLRQG